MPANIHQIPQEVVDSITELLPVADLKNSRFISPSWNSDYARRCLFRTVVLRMNYLSYQKLQTIARHKQFGTYIEYIVYDLRTVKVNPGDQGLTRWKENIAGIGLGLQRRAITRLVKQCSVGQVEMCHRNFCRYIDCQEFVERVQDETRIFATSIYDLPNLKGVEYSYQKKAIDHSIRALSLTSLSPMAQWMLAEPDAAMGEEKAEKRFWQWINSANYSKIGLFKELCLVDFKAHQFRYFGQYYITAYYEQFVLLFERLFIRITRYSDTEDYSGLIYMLGQTRDLKQLDLSFGVLQDGRGASPSMGLNKFIKDDKQWGQLTTLSLDGFNTSEEYLQHLLLRLAPSLHTLSLANITFQKQVALDPVASPSSGPVQFSSGGNGDHGSWIKLVIFLHDEMKLTSVSFRGWLYSPWDESWAVADHRSGECLKNRVERYAAAARYPDAEFPFRMTSRPKEMSKLRVKARGGTRGKGKRRGKARPVAACSLVVEDDESWQIVELK